MKKTYYLCLVLMLMVSCTKEEDLPRFKFLGSYNLLEDSTNKGITVISKGKKDNEIVWKLFNEEIEMEVAENLPRAFGTSFSLPLFLDNEANLDYISKDTLKGTRTSGSIFFPSTFSFHSYLLVRVK